LKQKDITYSDCSKMKKRIIVLTSDQPKGKGIVVNDGDDIKTLKERIKCDIFPELKEVQHFIL